MDIEQRAKTLTTTYIHSYNLALQEVRNPNLAAQIATAVTMVINTTGNKPFSGFLRTVGRAAGKRAGAGAWGKGGKRS